MARRSKKKEQGGCLETIFGVTVIGLIIYYRKYWPYFILGIIILAVVITLFDQKKSHSITSVSLAKVDAMEGHDFEHFCAKLLRNDGFSNVTVTNGSNDQGVDITAYKNGVKYAVQCKRYSKNLDNTPIQEVYTGKKLYGCSKAIVLTNSYFTKGAKEAANATGVILWDRDKLSALIRARGKSMMENDKTIKRIESRPTNDLFPPNPNAWPHCAVPEIDMRYYMDLPHVDYIEGQKKFVKMYLLTEGEPTGNDIVELVSEPFETDEEALHFAKALEKHCYAITKVEDQKVVAMAHYYSISANGIESDFEYYTFANWA